MEKIKDMKYFLLAIGIIAVEQYPTFYLKANQPLWQVWLLITVFLFISLGTLWIGKRLAIISSENILGKWQTWKISLIGFFSLFILKITGGIVLVIEKGNGATTANQSALEQLTVTPILLFIITVITAPIVEEMVFRGLILNKTFHFSYAGIAVSSFLFALLHTPMDFGSWIIYGGMGLVLGMVYKHSKKIEHALMIHFLNNFVAITLMFL
ncbi:CPBP family intramembrane glutamic endopeptidase [Streptococcus chenjunshii]|nr:type II CAAX endopeptidase family protein [Streptococcus chenjunshii]